jgi:1-acyl-sn-glycerol-3-phosphate acyltransferase
MLTALRLTRVALCLLIGFDAALAFARRSDQARAAFLRRWARGLLAALGVRLEVEGESELRAPALLVANHVSWLDVIALVAAQPATFVCKSEVAAWPGIGWLLRRVGTIFIRRGSFRDVWRVNMELRERFAAQRSVAAFPEGTTTAGDTVLAFRPALFEPAVERGLAVYPVAIAYSSQAAVYEGETTFLESLLSICAADRLTIHVALLPPLAPGLTRRQAAAQARGAICLRLARGLTAPSPRFPSVGAAAFSYTSLATPDSASRPGPRARRD